LSGTQAASRTAAPRSAAVDEIAGDSAKVSLAGAMLSQAASGSDVRFDKVAALRQSIETGAYAPTPDAVATKLIDSLQT
jgi:flagellar biosynthesis anti-sigma factor FlgM